MLGGHRWLGLCALAALLAACGTSGPEPGARSDCASAGGPLSQCPPESPESIDTPDDACWKMVECGAMPVARPDDRQDCGFCDWQSCVNFIDQLPDQQLELALACVQAAPCDELKAPGSPDDPDLPPCLEQGRR